MSCGSHPDVVEQVWHVLARKLPAEGRCLLFGTPALVDPVSGIVLAVCYGTQYCVRLPKGAIPAALRRGARVSMTWTLGGSTNIQKQFGRDWVFGHYLPEEVEWCEEVCRQFRAASRID
jgi:hypothetical protein